MSGRCLVVGDGEVFSFSLFELESFIPATSISDPPPPPPLPPLLFFVSAVHLAERVETGSYFAVKELQVDGPTKALHAKQVAALKQEVSIIARLQHPNIIRYHGSFSAGASTFIVMELVDGASLEEYLSSLKDKGQVRCCF